MSTRRRSTRTLALFVVAAGLAACSLAACGPATSGPRSADEVAQNNRDIDARLQGAWRIGSFQPDEPLGPTLDAMLAYHRQIMVVSFGNGRIRADSPGITFDRRYQVQNADGERFQLVAWDDTGTPQLSYCMFDPDGTLRVWMTSPWKGVGTLVRRL
jgi:hypothetical protein